MNSQKQTVDAELERLQHVSFKYFLHETNRANGLVIDKTEADWPASIAATGLALASYPVAVERGFLARAAAVDQWTPSRSGSCLRRPSRRSRPPAIHQSFRSSNISSGRRGPQDDGQPPTDRLFDNGSGLSGKQRSLENLLSS